ncbi:hypothetical protein BCR33DRAFT_767779 [Rhizoclosmatium globosum]|uniref:RING-type domain-containing protein n=1 Tax=Rhizoclosmatium globosum TaxID=329046 RepID=A0A1Y2C200_9FUNG|nr:hypothetical protein BCR33DRAFT_767779 [Rhizoclosmatium globosum]|eukprot:ORY41039.1 hypothetical protein BCR33DRAFT_767779 [Rhizoclosmatium globosum]
MHRIAQAETVFVSVRDEGSPVCVVCHLIGAHVGTALDDVLLLQPECGHVVHAHCLAPRVADDGSCACPAARCQNTWSIRRTGPCVAESIEEFQLLLLTQEDANLNAALAESESDFSDLCHSQAATINIQALNTDFTVLNLSEITTSSPTPFTLHDATHTPDTAFLRDSMQVRTCDICRQRDPYEGTFLEGHVLIQPNCNHSYHDRCLAPFLTLNECPVCKIPWHLPGTTLATIIVTNTTQEYEALFGPIPTDAMRAANIPPNYDTTVSHQPIQNPPNVTMFLHIPDNGRKTCQLCNTISPYVGTVLEDMLLTQPECNNTFHEACLAPHLPKRKCPICFVDWILPTYLVGTLTIFETEEEYDSVLRTRQKKAHEYRANEEHQRLGGESNLPPPIVHLDNLNEMPPNYHELTN